MVTAQLLQAAVFLAAAAIAAPLGRFLRMGAVLGYLAAGVIAVAAAIGALIAAPALDGRDPWFDYESWAVETAGAKTVTSALRGVVRDDARTRQEFLSLTGGNRR
jgi:hypothetical protein